MGIIITYPSYSLGLFLFRFFLGLCYFTSFLFLFWRYYKELEDKSDLRELIRKILISLTIVMIYELILNYILPYITGTFSITWTEALMIFFYGIIRSDLIFLVWIYYWLQIFRYGKLNKEKYGKLLIIAGFFAIMSDSYIFINNILVLLKSILLFIGIGQIISFIIACMQFMSFSMSISSLIVPILFIIFGVMNRNKTFWLLGVAIFVYSIIMIVGLMLFDPILMGSLSFYLILNISLAILTSILVIIINKKVLNVNDKSLLNDNLNVKH